VRIINPAPHLLSKKNGRISRYSGMDGGMRIKNVHDPFSVTWPIPVLYDIPFVVMISNTSNALMRRNA
jgi:hypothetical protein